MLSFIEGRYMKVILRSPALPLLVLGIVFKLPVSRVRPKAGPDPRSQTGSEAGRTASGSGRREPGLTHPPARA